MSVNVFDRFTSRIEEVTAYLTAHQLPLSLPAGPPAPDDPWSVPRPAAVDRTTLAWSTAVLMLASHHHTAIDRQAPAADALLRELGVCGLAQLHCDLNAGAPIDYRFTRCPYCDGIGEDPTLPTCQELGCALWHEYDGHGHMCPVCRDDDYQPQWFAEEHMAELEELLAASIEDKTPARSWFGAWLRRRGPARDRPRR